MSARVFDMGRNTGRGTFSNHSFVKPLTLDSLRETMEAVRRSPPLLTRVELNGQVVERWAKERDDASRLPPVGVEIKACDWMPEKRAWLVYSDGSAAVANLETGEVCAVPAPDALMFRMEQP